jgi:hypothetical protein
MIARLQRVLIEGWRGGFIAILVPITYLLSISPRYNRIRHTNIIRGTIMIALCANTGDDSISDRERNNKQ